MKIFISYVYYKSPSSDYNLLYFINNELKYRENIFYSIIINGYECTHEIPKLDNLSVTFRENIGYDFGGHNASLNKFNKDIPSFDYFFFLNSGVFGPILKDKDNFWYSKFISRFTDDVKLVGTTIVCLPKKDRGGYGPKVEGFFFALDKKGLELVLEDCTIFYDHKTKVDAILNGEYALSTRIFKSGFTIDCMLSKYQNINWHDTKNYKLNENKHPSRKNSYFGKSIDPFEVIFHKWYWHGKPYVCLDVIENYSKTKFII